MPFPGLTAALLLCLVLAACHRQPAAKGTPKKVEVKKVKGVFRLYKDGKPFLVKGGSGFTHMKELAACGGNTIRTWDTTGLITILDEAHRNQLSVIVGLD